MLTLTDKLKLVLAHNSSFFRLFALRLELGACGLSGIASLVVRLVQEVDNICGLNIELGAHLEQETYHYPTTPKQ